jgi:TolA-binding protein
VSTKPRFAAIVVSLLLVTLITPDSYASDKGEYLYKQTFQLYKSLASSQEKISDKEIWDTIARAFYSIYINYPQSDKAPNALFISGKMYEEMGERFGSKDDLETAVDYSRLFVKKYHESSLADDAQLRVARIVEIDSRSDAYLEYEKITTDYPNGDMNTIAKKDCRALAVQTRSEKNRYRQRARAAGFDSG